MYLDLHIHSCHSKDCSSPVASILAQAKKTGIDGIAICDHDTIKGSLEAEHLVEENGIDILVIPGIEVTTSRGHLLILGGREEFPKNLDPEEIIKKARALDCFVVAPHPFKGFPKSLGDVSGLDVDAVEVLNSRFILGWFNKRAETMACDLGLPGLGSSDAHYVEMVGRAHTEVDSAPSVESALQAIASGKTTVHGNRTPLRVQFRQTCSGFKRRANNLVKSAEK